MQDWFQDGKTNYHIKEIENGVVTILNQIGFHYLSLSIMLPITLAQFIQTLNDISAYFKRIIIALEQDREQRIDDLKKNLRSQETDSNPAILPVILEEQMTDPILSKNEKFNAESKENNNKSEIYSDLPPNAGENSKPIQLDRARSNNSYDSSKRGSIKINFNNRNSLSQNSSTRSSFSQNSLNRNSLTRNSIIQPNSHHERSSSNISQNDRSDRFSGIDKSQTVSADTSETNRNTHSRSSSQNHVNNVNSIKGNFHHRPSASNGMKYPITVEPVKLSPSRLTESLREFSERSGIKISQISYEPSKTTLPIDK